MDDDRHPNLRVFLEKLDRGPFPSKIVADSECDIQISEVDFRKVWDNRQPFDSR
jgi:hypothetical protein